LRGEDNPNSILRLPWPGCPAGAPPGLKSIYPLSIFYGYP
jgi:hypothetical protein